jgi:hypothetical protein
MYSEPAPHEVFQMLMPLFVFIGILYAAIMIVGLVSYILQGLAILNMSKARNLQNGWLGFIPIARDYQLGLCSKEIDIGNKKIDNPGLWMALAPFIYNAAFGVGFTIVLIPYFVGIISLVENPDSTDALMAFMGTVTTFVIGCFILALVMVVAQVFWYLVRFLVIHKIFSQYSTGQKPVFYLIIAMFVPLAEPILLYMHSKRRLLPAAVADFAPVPVAHPAAVPYPAPVAPYHAADPAPVAAPEEAPATGSTPEA